jgi:hypothetical protein
MNLESVSQLVAQHSSQSISTAQNKIVKAEQERAILKRMVQRMMWGMLLIGIGIILIVTNKSFAIRYIGLVSTLFLLGGTGLGIYGVLAALRDGIAISVGRLPPGISEATDVKLLPTQRDALRVPSVTERTTHLIARDGLPEVAYDDLHQDVSKSRE